jgi:hypothetical protein
LSRCSTHIIIAVVLRVCGSDSICAELYYAQRHDATTTYQIWLHACRAQIPAWWLIHAVLPMDLHAVQHFAARAVLRLAGVGPLATMVFYSVSTWAVVV